MPAKKIWSAEEEEALAEYYMDLSDSDLAEVIGVSTRAVQKKLREMNLSRREVAVELTGERWRTIPGVNGYSVSGYGRIRNDIEGTILKQTKDKKGYYHVSITSKQSGLYKKNFIVHRIVAEVFLPCDGMEELTVNHKDGVKSNNRKSNLEWMTRPDNLQHARDNGLHDVKGENCHLNKYPEEMIHKICKLIVKGKQNREITLLLGLEKNYVDKIRRRQTWKHVSCKYKW